MISKSGAKDKCKTLESYPKVWDSVPVHIPCIWLCFVSCHLDRVAAQIHLSCLLALTCLSCPWRGWRSKSVLSPALGFYFMPPRMERAVQVHLSHILGTAYLLCHLEREKQNTQVQWDTAMRQISVQVHLSCLLTLALLLCESFMLRIKTEKDKG